MNQQRNTAAGFCKAVTPLLLACCTATLFCFSAAALSPQGRERDSSDRRVVTRIEPEYPETLRRLFIGGTVRLQVTVEPNGKVESTELLGGNPILGQSAMKAVKQWKYASAQGTEKLVVQLDFDPHR